MNLITLSSVGAALLLVGCVAKTGTRALSMDHPANPQAKEVVYVPPSSVLAMEGKMELDEKTGTGSAGQHAQGSHATPIDHSQHVQP